MANDTTLTLPYASGANLYTQVRGPDNSVWNGTAFVSFVLANWGTYATATPETPASSGFYVGQFPTSAPAGKYRWATYLQAGGSPASTDVAVGTGSDFWDGTTFGVGGQVLATNATLSGYNNLLAVGTVSDVSPQAGTFVISLSTGTLPGTNAYVGRDLCFTAGAGKIDKQEITGYSLLSSTTARLSFTNPFAQPPANGDAFTII